MRAAHKWLLAEPNCRPHHISLYMALFHQWNSGRFPNQLRIERVILMQEARIGSKATFNTALRELESWDMLTYHPTRNSFEGSRVSMIELGGELSPQLVHPDAICKPRSGPTDAKQHSPEVSQPVSPEVSYPSPSDSPEVGHHSLLDKTPTNKHVQVNGTVAAAQKKSERGIDDELSKKPLKKASGIHSARIRAAAAAQLSNPSPNQGKSPALDVPFSESEVAVLSAFCAAFVGTDYELADLAFYHELVGSWRDKKTGEAPRRKDWVATAKRFMLNDARDNRLKLAPGVQQHSAGTSNSQIPPTGYRSSRFD